MSSRLIPRLNPGDVLTAAHYNRLVDACNRMRVTVAAPLDAVQTAGGTMVRLTDTSILRIGKLDAALTYVDGTESVVCSIWEGVPGAEADTGNNVTVYCRLLTTGQAIASGSWVLIGLFNGYWQIISTACPA